MRPASKFDLFWSFSLLALQGFGGVQAIVQRELIEKKQWLTKAEFMEDWAVAQVLPGPNVVNLSLMIGDRHFGTSGALAAMAGMLCFPLVIVLALVAIFSGLADLPQVQGALRGMGAVAAGLITAAALKLIPALGQSPMGMAACALLALFTLACVVVLHLPLVWVLVLAGLPACGWAYWNLQRREV